VLRSDRAAGGCRDRRRPDRIALPTAVRTPDDDVQLPFIDLGSERDRSPHGVEERCTHRVTATRTGGYERRCARRSSQRCVEYSNQLPDTSTTTRCPLTSAPSGIVLGMSMAAAVLGWGRLSEEPRPTSWPLDPMSSVAFWGLSCQQPTRGRLAMSTVTSADGTPDRLRRAWLTSALWLSEHERRTWSTRLRCRLCLQLRTTC
jgi:hypothetical protein